MLFIGKKLVLLWSTNLVYQTRIDAIRGQILLPQVYVQPLICLGLQVYGCPNYHIQGLNLL